MSDSTIGHRIDRSTGWALVALATIFYVLWLAEDVPATVHGEAPAALEEVGLPANPVHALDPAFLLPACILPGLGLVRRKTFGYVFAPTLMCCLAIITVGIVTIMIMTIVPARRDLCRWLSP